MTNNPMSPFPFISILIVTRNNHDECQRAVDSICAGTWPEDCREIIVLEETEAPQPVTGPNVHYHTLPVRNLGVGYARNRALEEATGEIIVFTDDDCIADPRWLDELVRPLLDDPQAVVYHRPRDRWSKVIPWFARRGQAAVEMLQFRSHRNAACFKLLRNSPLLRIAGLLVLLTVARLPLLPALGLIAALYYLFLLFRFRWAWSYHPDWKTFAILPALKLTLDLSMDAGILRTLLRQQKNQEAQATEAEPKN
jgi:glycosyltransferase involved in cell wall biosynthesis